MKTKIIPAIIFATASLLSLNSCKKDKATVAVSTSSTISSDPTLTIFSAIVSRSGDNALVNSSGAIVAPVDSAFISAGITAGMVANLSVADCDSIVRYYTIPAGLTLNGTTSSEVAVGSLLGPALYADSSTSALYFNGTAALSPVPVVVGTTSIYKLTQFVNLPASSVSQIASSDNNLSLFNEAYNRTNLAASLAPGSFYTVLMPNNTAFINAGYPNIASIDSADINVLTQLLLYQTIPSDYFDNDLLHQSSVTTLQGGTIQLNNASGSVQLIGNSDPGSPANLVSNSLLAGSNVLAYKTNSLLLP
jgi:uncharacterized surface protein with fasciclin (FAS1) repeats